MLCRQYDATTALDVGARERRRAARRARERDRRVVPPDAHALADRAADVQGGVQRRRRRPRGHPAAGGRRDDALLHVRGGPRGTQRVRGAPRAGVREVPEAPVTATDIGRTARWVAGARPRTLPASIVPVLVGRRGRTTRPDAVGAARAVRASSRSSLQVGTNYANDYADGVRGTDARRVGPLRLVASGLASPAAVRTAALCAFGRRRRGRARGSPPLTTWWLLAVGVAAIARRLGVHRRPPSLRLRRARRAVRLRVLRARRDRRDDVLPHRAPDGAVAWSPARRWGSSSCALLDANNLRDLDGDAVAKQAHDRGAARARARRMGLRRPRRCGPRAARRRAPSWRPAALARARRGAARDRTGAHSCSRGATGPALLPVLVRTARLQLVAGLALAVGLWWSS